MRSRSSTLKWTTLLTKLGFSGRKYCSRSTGNNMEKRKLRFEQCEDRRMLATFNVNVAYDAGGFDDADGIMTLREAVFEANDSPDLDIIHFAPNLDGVPITLGTDINGNSINLISELLIRESLTIDAEGQDITIDGSGYDLTPNVNDGEGLSVLVIDFPGFPANQSGGQQVTLAGLTITGGDSMDDGGGIDLKAFSADVPNLASLTIIDTVIRDNHAARNGGGLALNNHETGTGFFDINIIRSTIKNNTASSSGFVSGGGGLWIGGGRPAGRHWSGAKPSR